MSNVYNGQDLTGPKTARPLGNRPANSGEVFWDQTDRRLFAVADHLWPGMLIPVDGRAVYSAASPRHLYDDFGGGINSTIWTTTKGSDAQSVIATAVTGAPNGEITLVSGDAGTGIAGDGSVICSPLVFEAEEGKIVAYWRAKISNISDVWMFFGFTDTLSSGTLEQPASLSGTTYTTTATDAIGFLYDTAATTDTFRLVGVANDVDATHVDTAVAPVADTYIDFILVIDTDGSAIGYINGTQVGTLAAGAVRPTIDLCLFAGVNSRTTTIKTMTVDAMGAR